MTVPTNRCTCGHPRYSHSYVYPQGDKIEFGHGDVWGHIGSCRALLKGKERLVADFTGDTHSCQCQGFVKEK